MVKTVVLLVIVALLVGACMYYPVGEGRGDEGPRMVVTAVVGDGSATVVPPDPRPTPEYRGTPVISWCTGGHCKPSVKPR